MLLRRVSISLLRALSHGSQLKCCQEVACCVGKLHMHIQTVSTCSEQERSLRAALVCTEDQSVMKKAVLATGATLGLSKGWSASASIKYWET